MLRREFSKLILNGGVAVFLGSLANRAIANTGDGVAGSLRRKWTLRFLNRERKNELVKRIIVTSKAGAMQLSVTSLKQVDES